MLQIVLDGSAACSLTLPPHTLCATPIPRHVCVLHQNAANDAALSCSLTITVDRDMPAPVYVFYEMDGLLQNHRR